MIDFSNFIAVGLPPKLEKKDSDFDYKIIVTRGEKLNIKVLDLALKGKNVFSTSCKPDNLAKWLRKIKEQYKGKRRIVYED